MNSINAFVQDCVRSFISKSVTSKIPLTYVGIDCSNFKQEMNMYVIKTPK